MTFLTTVVGVGTDVSRLPPPELKVSHYLTDEEGEGHLPQSFLTHPSTLKVKVTRHCSRGNVSSLESFLVPPSSLYPRSVVIILWGKRETVPLWSPVDLLSVLRVVRVLIVLVGVVTQTPLVNPHYYFGKTGRVGPVIVVFGSLLSLKDGSR